MARHQTRNTPPIIGPVISHRGAAGHAPENTIAAIEKAAAMGVRWIEIDAKLTADGAVVLFHDDRLERTTDGLGKAAETVLADFRRLDAGSWFGADFAGERVPTLIEAIDACARLELGAVVEIKPCPGRAADTGAAVAGLLAERWPDALPSPLISSFEDAALVAARARVPNLGRALNVFRLPWGWRRRLDALGCAALHCRARDLNAQRIAAVTGAGFDVRAFTVNAPARAAALFRWGVAGVFSDFPDRIAGLAGRGAAPGQ